MPSVISQQFVQAAVHRVVRGCTHFCSESFAAIGRCMLALAHIHPVARCRERVNVDSSTQYVCTQLFTYVGNIVKFI